MKEPTQEQIKEFWKWCGFNYSDDWSNTIPYKNPQGEIVRELPIDLNNLFKYAVPKLNAEGGFINLMQASMNAYWKAQVWFPFDGTLGGKILPPVHHETPALALFWAIYQVIKLES